MEKQELLNIISNKHQGAYVQVTYQTNITPNKNFKGHVITKVVQSVVRFGVRYSNIKSVIEKRQAIGMVGEIKEVLPWGEWKKGILDLLVAVAISATYIHYNGCAVIEVEDKSFEGSREDILNSGGDICRNSFNPAISATAVRPSPSQ